MIYIQATEMESNFFKKLDFLQWVDKLFLLVHMDLL